MGVFSCMEHVGELFVNDWFDQIGWSIMTRLVTLYLTCYAFLHAHTIRIWYLFLTCIIAKQPNVGKYPIHGWWFSWIFTPPKICGIQCKLIWSCFSGLKPPGRNAWVVGFYMIFSEIGYHHKWLVHYLGIPISQPVKGVGIESVAGFETLKKSSD